MSTSKPVKDLQENVKEINVKQEIFATALLCFGLVCILAAAFLFIKNNTINDLKADVKTAQATIVQIVLNVEETSVSLSSLISKVNQHIKDDKVLEVRLWKTQKQVKLLTAELAELRKELRK